MPRVVLDLLSHECVEHRGSSDWVFVSDRIDAGDEGDGFPVAPSGATSNVMSNRQLPIAAAFIDHPVSRAARLVMRSGVLIGTKRP